MPFIILPSPNPHMSPNAGSFIPRPPLCMCQKGERRNVGEKEVGCLNSLLVCRGRRSTLSSSTSLPRAMGERETETSRLEKGKEGGMGPCKAGWQAQPSFFHFQFRRTWGGGLPLQIGRIARSHSLFFLHFVHLSLQDPVLQLHFSPFVLFASKAQAPLKI